MHYKIGWQELFEEYDEADRPRPDILPHPDDIHIDAETGEVFVLGTLTKDQRGGEDERLHSISEEEIAAFKKEAVDLKEYLAASELPIERSIVEKDIGLAKAAIRHFQKILRNMKGRFRIKCLLSPDSTGNSFKIEQY
ncbi:MAG: hypothetical protein ACR2PA_25730 [Hyphomicrobiaceae bacterium]